MEQIAPDHLLAKVNIQSAIAERQQALPPWLMVLALLAGETVTPPEPARPGPVRHIKASDKPPGLPDMPELPDRLVSPACWCRQCDMAANSGWLSRMSLCPTCGDKNCPRSASHDAKCAPPEKPPRKPAPRKRYPRSKARR